MSIPTYGVLKRAGPLFILVLQALGSHLHKSRSRARENSAPLPAITTEKESADACEDTQERCASGGEEGGASASTCRRKGRPREETGPGVVAGVLVICAGALAAGAADLYLSAPALLMALCSNLTQGLYHLAVESKHRERVGMGRLFDYGPGVDRTVGLLVYNSLLSLPFFVLIIGSRPPPFCVCCVCE